MGWVTRVTWVTWVTSQGMATHPTDAGIYVISACPPTFAVRYEVTQVTLVTQKGVGMHALGIPLADTCKHSAIRL